MPRCWPRGFGSRSKKAAAASSESTKAGKTPDSGSSTTSTSTAEAEAKTELEEKKKEEKVEDEKKEEKKPEEESKTESKEESKEDKDGDESKDKDKDEKKEEDKPKVPVGSVSEPKNIYKGSSDDDGNWTWVDKYPEDVEEAAENEETAKYAIVVRNQKSNDSRKKLEAHSIIVQSPWLRKALAEIMEDYPGVACELTRLEFEAPFKPFVHRWYDIRTGIPTLALEITH